MKYAWKKHAALLSITAIFIGYIAWSQVYIYQISKKLSVEEKRVFSIARNLELWKDITINYNGYLDQEKLLQNNEEIEIVQIDRNASEMGMQGDEKLYTVYYKGPSNKILLKRYFSELVLGSYFFMLTDSDGKIQEFFWDKP